MNNDKHNNVKHLSLGLCMVLWLAATAMPVSADSSELRGKIVLEGVPTVCEGGGCIPPMCEGEDCIPSVCEGEDCSPGGLGDLGNTGAVVVESSKTASIACDAGTGACVGAYGAACAAGFTTEDECGPTVAWCTKDNRWNIQGEVKTGNKKLSIRFVISCAGVELADCIADDEKRACVSLEVKGDGEVGCFWYVNYGEPQAEDVGGRCVDPLRPEISIPVQPLPEELANQLNVSEG